MEARRETLDGAHYVSGTMPNTAHRLSWRLKCGYASGNIGILYTTSAVNFYLSFFYMDVVALAPMWVAVALMIPRLWDAVSDPLMGAISDRTSSRAGRRRPYLLWGAPLLALSFVLLWYPFAGGSRAVVFTYMLCANIFFSTMITVVMVPYTSLGGELSQDYHERTAVFAWSQGLGQLGGIIGMWMVFLAIWLAKEPSILGGFRFPQSIWPPFETDQFSFMVAAALLSIPCCGPLLWTYRVTRSVDRGHPVSHKISMARLLTTSLRSRSFRCLALVQLIVTSGWILGNQSMPFMVKYWVGRPDLLSLAFTVFIVAAWAGFPLWKMLGTRVDKALVLAIGFCAAAVVNILSFPAFQPGGVVLMLSWATLLGLCAAPQQLFPFSMIADIVDEDELQTGTRSEGTFYGAYSLIAKLSLAIGALWTGIGMKLAGYTAGTEPSPHTMLMLRLLYMTQFPCLFVAAFIIYRWYPLSRARVRELKEALARR